MKKIQRNFETEKAARKLQAIHLWKAGKKMTEIARSLECSRETVYRWLKLTESGFSAKSKRNRFRLDEMTKCRILETYVLMGRPSVASLHRELQGRYAIMYSMPQLRRMLKRFGWSSYRPSPFRNELFNLSK